MPIVSRDFELRSRRVTTPDGVRPAAVSVRGGRIEHVGKYEQIAPGRKIVECGDLAVFPGVVDPHVHVNEPGRTEWEGFATATRAAAAGGVTTLVDMPLNSIPATTTRAALASKREAAQGQCRVDVGFWGGVVPGNSQELEGLWRDGVRGFKAFLVPSGVEEFGHVAEDELRTALPILARLEAPLLVHAELPGPLAAAEQAWSGAGPAELRQYERYLRSRPDAAEVEAIELLVRLCRETGARIHVVHLATAEALDLLRAARQEGLPLTVETCPHYLTLSAEEIADGDVAAKCAPPIRSAAHRERLWDALLDGTIDLVASDHSPSPPARKHLETGDFRAAWGGIASLQLLLPLVWTEARRRGAGLPDLARWLCAAPAQLAGLAGRKGAIAPGCDADFVVWDPDARFVVDPERLEHRHKLTPYAGRTLDGVVHKTFVRGVAVYDEGAFADRPTGELILRR